MFDNAEISARAREEMTKRNLSARRLAKTLEINSATVLDFLHGRRKTHASVVKLICQELGLDTDLSKSAADSGAQI